MGSATKRLTPTDLVAKMSKSCVASLLLSVGTKLHILYATLMLPGLISKFVYILKSLHVVGGSVDEWLACWTQEQKGLGSNRSRDAVG